MDGMRPAFTKFKTGGKTYIRTYMQRLFITLQLYGENGLANHAAACAYGFLLSMAPMLLLIAFFIFKTFEPSAGAIASLIGNIPFLNDMFDASWLSSDFFSFNKPGISGIISVLSIIWAGRILALSIQRGLKIIFPADKNRNPVTETLVTFVIEAAVLIFILIAIVGSRTALRFYKFIDFIPQVSLFHFFTSRAGSHLSTAFFLGVVSFFVYLFVPVIPPKKFSAFQGALFCTVSYYCTALFLRIILDISRFNFLYGTLGNLIILLINVFFFFSFFFLGAQLSFVIEFFDALLFSKLRQTGFVPVKHPPGYGLLNKIFHPPQGNFSKYLRNFKKGETILSHGGSLGLSSGGDVFYLIEGEVEVFIVSAQGLHISTGVLKGGSFFGERGYLLSEDSTAVVKAKTDVSAFALPPSLFDAVLKHDAGLDRELIEHTSRRIKDKNDNA